MVAIQLTCKREQNTARKAKSEKATENFGSKKQKKKKTLDRIQSTRNVFI